MVKQQWRKLSLETTPAAVSVLSELLLSYGLQGLQIEDPTDFVAFLVDPPVRSNGISQDLLAEQHRKDPTTASIVFYLPDTLPGRETLTAIQADLARLQQNPPEIPLGSLALTKQTIKQQDWDTAWKQYYHPIPLGKRLLICPSWEDCPAAPDQVKVLLDPGMAFGTGTHQTTKLCLTLLESAVTKNTTLLDIGTGSGILSIAALLLGARSATAVDIDPLAVSIAAENAALNHVADRLTLHCGDLADQVSGRFSLICANIVADVILRLAGQVQELLHQDGVLLISGIIADRVDEVVDQFAKQGLELVTSRSEEDWFALKFRLAPSDATR